MEKVKIFKTFDAELEKTETRINNFLNDKKFISLTQSQSPSGANVSVIFTLVYKEINKGGIEVINL